MPWRIEISEVPIDRQSDPRFIEFCARIQNSDPRQITATCVHEAAHGIYMRRAGAIDLKRRGIVVGYDSQQDDFFISPAAVAPVFPKPWKARLDAVARYYAAGGVAMRRLTTETHTGDEKDFDDFCGFCNDYFPQEAANAARRWREGQDAVQRDLRTPAFRQEVWAEARQFEGWLRDHSK